jgi:hypothetical protein
MLPLRGVLLVMRVLLLLLLMRVRLQWKYDARNKLLLCPSL